MKSIAVFIAFVALVKGDALGSCGEGADCEGVPADFPALGDITALTPSVAIDDFPALGVLTMDAPCDDATEAPASGDDATEAPASGDDATEAPASGDNTPA